MRGMRALNPQRREALHDSAATRALEQALAAALPPHTLMARAGEAVARLALALHPHARRIWVACGPGNNGGDGLIAALHLQRSAPAGWREIWVTHDAELTRLPADAAWALREALAGGLTIQHGPPDSADLVIDALLGLGARALAHDALAQRVHQVRGHAAPLLCVDTPSGLNPDTGQDAAGLTPRHRAPDTLSLLSLKPGLFTADGRDAAGRVWFEPLQAEAITQAACAHWGGADSRAQGKQHDPHVGHKGRYGDVAVLGGQLPGPGATGMAGAAVLAARAALHAGAGRVYLALVGDGPAPTHDPMSPELMLRTPASLFTPDSGASRVLVAGCGGGTAVRAWLPAALGSAAPMVLDADALNAIAQDAALAQSLRERGERAALSVLTPHPLEAARLLGTDTATLMGDRLRHAQALADRFAATVVLKGSGSVVAAPSQRPWINATGNARLATAGTSDVLAGLIGAALARSPADALRAVCNAVAQHGALADAWPAASSLTADVLARAAQPV